MTRSWRRPVHTGKPARGHQSVEDLLGVVSLESLGFRLGFGLHVIAAGPLFLAPVLEVGVPLLEPGLRRGTIDGGLETLMKDDLVRLTAILGDDLGGDVAPPDDREHCRHQAAPANART